MLGIDFDPQGAFSAACGAVNYNVLMVYKAAKQAAVIGEPIQRIKGGYDMVLANIMLAGAEQKFYQI